MSQKSKAVFEKGDRKCVSQTTAAHVQCPRCQHMTTWEKTPAQKHRAGFLYMYVGFMQCICSESWHNLL